MTLPAVDNWNVRGLADGPVYTVGPRCSNPHCRKIAEHAHHIMRRTRIGGDYAWIQIDNVVIANKTGVCFDCHSDLTGDTGGHKAAIRWDQGLFVWCNVVEHGADPEYIAVGPIVPQPPTPESLAARATGPESESDACPYCGHETRRRSPVSRPGGRRRKSWIVLVPDEHEENGADVLDSLVDNLAPLIPNADSSARGRYYVLVPTLAYAMMEGKRFVQTMAGVGG